MRSKLSLRSLHRRTDPKKRDPPDLRWLEQTNKEEKDFSGEAEIKYMARLPTIKIRKIIIIMKKVPESTKEQNIH
jgi:hypothetical protein